MTTPALPLTVSRRPSRLRLALMAALAGAMVLLAWPQVAERIVHRPRAEAFLTALHHDPVLLDAIRDQNRALAGMGEDELQGRDKAWIAERAAGGGPLITGMLALPASRHAAALVEATEGTVRHLIVMDDRGRNVAVAAPTSDYWQGDEAKWLETFGHPPGTRHRGARERGHEGWFVACWVSEPLADPATGEPLGAFAAEVDAWRVPSLCGP